MKKYKKQIKFSKGQIAPELIERTDLEAYNSSAQKMDNVVSTIYGGVRSRRGTRFISSFIGGKYNNKENCSLVSSIGGTGDLFNGSGWSSNVIGTQREILRFSLGKNNNGVVVFLDGIRSSIDDREEILYKADDSHTEGSVTLREGQYRIVASASGGSSVSWSENHSKWWNGADSGGSGAGVDAVYHLGGLFKATTSMTEPEATIDGIRMFKLYAGKNASKDRAGKGGDAIFSTIYAPITKKIYSKGADGASVWGKQASGVLQGASLFGAGGMGSAGTSSYWSTYNATNPGNKGGFKLQAMGSKMTFIVYASINGDAWQEVGKFTTERQRSANSFQMPEGYTMAKIVLDEPDSEDIRDAFGVKSIAAFSSAAIEVESDAKLIPFSYSQDQNYLFVLTDEKISIYRDDVLLEVVTATGLKGEFIKNIKTTAKDDLMVFSHAEMPTKSLKRTLSGWVWEDVPLENIPYTAFEGEKKEEKTTGITPTATEGSLRMKAEGDIFDASWEGQFIDGNGGRMRIVEFVNAREVNGVTVIPFYTTDKITKWTKISGYEPSWSEKRGYPAVCLFAQQRLWFGGSKSLPSNIWASRTGDYYNFKNSGNYDNDSINVKMLTNNRIYDLVENRGIHVLTSGDEWTAPEGGLTPDKISFLINTKNGTVPNVSPIILDGAICFVEKNGGSILSYAYDYNQAGYTSNDISVFTNVIRRPVSMAVLKNSIRQKGDFIFVVLEDGTMLVVCASIKQSIFSPAVFKTSGKVKDVCCVGDDVYLLISRGNTNSLERISEDFTDMTSKVYFDNYSMGNLSIYSGNYVYVYSATRNYGKHKVVDGVVNLTETPNEICYVGIPYEYQIESNPIAINNQTTSRKKRIATATITTRATNRLTFSGQTKEGRDVYQFFACTPYENDVRFRITGEFYKMEILSVFLELNCEG